MVEGDKEQILTYTSIANREDTILSFQVSTGRGTLKDVVNYKILYSDGSKEYDDFLIAGRQQHSVIQFGEIINHDNPPEIQKNILYANYPNPFNPETKISFRLAESSNITLNIYNPKGQLVKTVLSGKYQAGLQTIVWNGTDDAENRVSSGVYLYKLETDSQVLTRKMLLMK